MRSRRRRRSCSHPTLENYHDINERANYLKFFLNSVIESVGATIVCILLAAPAAYAMAFFPTPKTKDILMWMLSTKMMPAVGVLVPIYLIGIKSGLLDSRSGIVIVYTLMNLPIVVWMLYSFFREVPKEILEAARMDGATPVQQIARTPAAAVAARHLLDGAAVDHHLLERGVLEHQPNGRHGRPADGLHRLASRAPKVCSGPSCRPRRSWPSPPFWCSAGLPSANSSAA